MANPNYGASICISTMLLVAWQPSFAHAQAVAQPSIAVSLASSIRSNSRHSVQSVLRQETGSVSSADLDAAADSVVSIILSDESLERQINLTQALMGAGSAAGRGTPYGRTGDKLMSIADARTADVSLQMTAMFAMTVLADRSSGIRLLSSIVQSDHKSGWHAVSLLRGMEANDALKTLWDGNLVTRRTTCEALQEAAYWNKWPKRSGSGC